MVQGGRQVVSTLGAILFAVPCINAQAKRPVETGAAWMGTIVRASAPGENIRQIWAYSDPRDGRHMIACGMLSSPPTNAIYGYVYSSSDAGATWRRTLLDDATHWVSEESCTYAEGGRAYFVDGQSDMSTGSPRHEFGYLQLFTSSDHGMSWKPAGRREFVDWTMLAALPADKDHAESVVIFGNLAADKVGHWWQKQPVALEATDDAQTLSALVAAPINSSRNFGGGSVVLDRTALFMLGVTDPKYASNPSQHRQVTLFAYRPSERSLEVRATLRNEPGRAVLLPFIVRDMSRQFHGRLYVVWSEMAWPGPDAQLWLATSDDSGYHWSSRAIFSMADYRTLPGCPTDFFSAPPDVRIALNGSGALGVLWKQDAQTLLFSVSHDGGRTFTLGQLVVQQPIGELSVDDAVPFNEWWLGETLAGLQGRSKEFIHTFVDLSHLGLSVRLSKHNGVGDFALTADANNSFHALWTEIGANGNYALMTRTIDVTSANSPTYSVLTKTFEASMCGEDTAHLQPDGPSPVPPLDLAEQTEVSGSLSLQIDHVKYAAESHIVTAQITVTNKGEGSLRGSLSFFGVGLHSDFGVATPLNASGTKLGQPFWNLSAVIPPDGLSPKASSKPIELQFKIDPFHSVPIGDAVAMQVRVFAQNAMR